MSNFYNGMAEIFEVDPANVSPEFDLLNNEMPWDSLTIVSTIGLVDECFDVLLNGEALMKCQTIGDIEALVAAARGN